MKYVSMPQTEAIRSTYPTGSKMRLLFAAIALLSVLVLKPVTPPVLAAADTLTTACASDLTGSAESDECYALYVAPDALPAWT